MRISDWSSDVCSSDLSLATDPGATYDKIVVIDAADIAPSVTWGTSPEDVVPITGSVPDPASFADPSKQAAAAKSLAYMGLEPGTRMQELPNENINIGSCPKSPIDAHPPHAPAITGTTQKPASKTPPE